ncbi:MAG: DMT family transporter [Sedimentisphaerales bacterium]|nr:DMT family transporter [Sedimentisphaerales bacterium]
MWIVLGIVSAIFLGMYDISKKHALNKNAVLPVLFFSTFFGALAILPFLILSHVAPETMISCKLYIPPLTWSGHLNLLAKSALITVAWMMSYFALSNLPISVISPIGAFGPVWTLIGAILLFHENPSHIQFLGIAVIMASYGWLSVVGRSEGIVFYKNKWILFSILSTMLGAVSAMYDKQMIQRWEYSPLAVQAWFTIYIVPLMGIVTMFFWWPGRSRFTPFRWRWSIILIGLMLLAADYLYFKALSYTGSLVGMLITLRCSYIVISLVAGGILFKETQLSRKACALCGILMGVFLIFLSK